MMTLLVWIAVSDSPVREDVPVYAHAFWRVINGSLGFAIGLQVSQWYSARKQQEKRIEMMAVGEE